MAMGMLLNGAQGPTLDSLEKTLGDAGVSLEDVNTAYKSISAVLTNLDTKVVFQIANSVWYQNGFPVVQKFLDDNANYFDAEVHPLDFSQASAVSAINGWVDTKTHGKISSIIDGIPENAVLFLINAIYYKGTWTYQFDPQKTVDTDFTCAGGASVRCKLMTQEAAFSYYSDETLQVIDLPYGDRRFSMTIILPAAGISIDQYAASLSQTRWDALLSQMDSLKVIVSIPKFKLEYAKTLNDELKTMGMGIAFGPNADLTHIQREGGLNVTAVLHKTFVEVNEEGTEAAAVTAIMVGTTVSVKHPVQPVMRVDRPFIFAIREHSTGTILFIGKIVNPNP